MNTLIVDAVTPGTAALQARRASLSALAAMALGAATMAPRTTESKKKSCNMVRKKALKEADLRCQLQRPTCEASLSAVCQPGSDIQECLDNTAECCQFLANCDAQAAIECVVFRFIVA
jgi:hypothetical protein